ncbi:hypothetical protein QOZ96_003597 [Brevundimonas nasdae]|uniref:hypothetical protein n=1 Tax=Brevundimonas nasdae TaxID=172043 RepID=UPI00191193DA|nr:hypothetical protein [Brevundimonas nasdae]MBK6024537.1 hypothetical protein [Brevundimonas nasdae]MDQ0453624.1 hypothetical protein [Brevundimonas nasdae]
MTQPSKLIVVTTTEPRQYLTEARAWSSSAADAEQFDWPDVAAVIGALPKGTPAAPVRAEDA